MSNFIKLITMEANQITRRFFVTFDSLIESGKIEGKQTGFCERHGINRTYFGQARTKQWIQLRPDTIAALCTEFPTVNLEYIMLGTGPVFK